MTKRYINVAYKDRDMAKRLGARWDASVKRWYCPPDSALAKVYGWRKAPTGPDLGNKRGDISVPSGLTAGLASTHHRGQQLSLLG